MIGSTGNADSIDYTVTEIRHAAGDEALAKTLAGSVPGAKVKVGEDAVSNRPARARFGLQRRGSAGDRGAAGAHHRGRGPAGRRHDLLN